MSHGPDRLPAEDWSLYDLYQRVEMPIVEIIDHMQRFGVKIDRGHMSNLHIHYQEQMERLTEEAAALLGVNVDDCYSLNSDKERVSFLGSPEKVAHVLYDQIKLKPPKMTDSGKHGATDEESLKRLRETTSAESTGGRFMKLLIGTEGRGELGYRGYEKLDTSYCKKALDLADADDRIYTTLKQTRVVSGRLSSAEPFNFMAIPQDGHEAKVLRRGFVPGVPSWVNERIRRLRDVNNWVMLKLDFSQIEMRIMGHASLDPKMCTTFILDQDIHSETASLMFSIPVENVDKDRHRYPAKRVGFGTLFGLTERGLLPHLPQENRNMEFAKWMINRYWEVYADVKSLVDEKHQHARRYHWIPDEFGRVRWIPEVMSSIPRIVESGLREAFSHYIQGTAQGCIKIPMGHTLHLIDKYGLDCFPWIQIHDEMDFVVRRDQAMDAAEIFGQEYANAVKLNVPIKVEVEIGENWGEMEHVLSVTSKAA